MGGGVSPEVGFESLKISAILSLLFLCAFGLRYKPSASCCNPMLYQASLP